MNQQRSLLGAILHSQDGKSIRLQAPLLQTLVATGHFTRMAVKSMCGSHDWVVGMCATGLPSPREWGLTGSQARTCTPWEDILGYYVFLFYYVFLSPGLRFSLYPSSVLAFGLGMHSPEAEHFPSLCESWVQFPVRRSIDLRQGFVSEELRSQEGCG